MHETLLKVQAGKVCIEELANFGMGDTVYDEDGGGF